MRVSTASTEASKCLTKAVDEDSTPLILHKSKSSDATLSPVEETQLKLSQPYLANEYSLDIIIKHDQVSRRGFGYGRNESWDKAKQFITSQSLTMTTHSSIVSDSNTSPIKCSNMGTMMNLIKGTAGTGILSLPLAFKYSGLWVGLILFLTISSVAVHCMHIVNNCSGLLEKRSKVIVQSYPDTIEQCFYYGPQSLRIFATLMRNTVTGFILVIQCGFCCIYIVWVAVNVKQVVDQFWAHSLDVRVYEVFVSLLLLPYLMVKSLRSLAIFSAFANIIYLIGLIIIFQYMLQDLPDSRLRPAFNSWSKLPMFFGTAVFSFENMCLVIPLRHKIKQQEDFGGWTGVLNLGMVITTAVYTAMGFYGYLRFEDGVAATVTLNLPQDQWLYLSINLMFAIAVFMTVGVQFYVPVNIICPAVDQKLSERSDTFRKFAEYAIRASLLAVISLMAVIVPHLDLLMSLVGSFCGSILALILPALVELLTLYEEKQLTVIIAVKDIFILTIGLTGFVTGSYTSFKDILNTF